MKRAMTVVALGSVLLTSVGCNATRARALEAEAAREHARAAEHKAEGDKQKADGTASAKKSDKSGKGGSSIEELETKLEIAAGKLEKANLDLQSAEISAEVGIARAEAELKLARERLKQFDELDMPARLAQNQLNLTRSRDRAQEAADELAQIEIMYEEQDLEDRTAEFVVSRGRRNAERQQEQIKISEKQARSLEQFTIPMERKRIELDVKSKTDALDKARRSRTSDLLSKRLSLMSAEMELKKAQQALDKKKEGDEEDADKEGDK